MRATGYQLVGQGILLDGVAEPHHLGVIVIDIVVAGLRTLPVTPVALYTRNAVGREHAIELRVLIGGDDVVILAFQQFRQVRIRIARVAIIDVFNGAQHHGPMLAPCEATVVKGIEHVVYPVFPRQPACQFAEYFIVLIVKHESRSGGHPRRAAHDNGIGLVNLLS